MNPETQKLLDDLQERCEQAKRNYSHWPITVVELKAAYEAGERNFDRASLDGANLTRARLDGANLYGASLDGANLDGASLTRANLPEGWHILQIGPVGSRLAYTLAVIQPDGARFVQTGCFSGSLDEFIAAVQRKPEDDEHRLDYEAMVIPALKHFFAKHAKVEVMQEAVEEAAEA